MTIYDASWTQDFWDKATGVTLKVSINTLVRKDMDINEHVRIFNITLRHKLK